MGQIDFGKIQNYDNRREISDSGSPISFRELALILGSVNGFYC